MSHFNVENHAYWHKLFKYELRLQENPGTVLRSAYSITFSLYLFSVAGFHFFTLFHKGDPPTPSQFSKMH